MYIFLDADHDPDHRCIAAVIISSVALSHFGILHEPQGSTLLHSKQYLGLSNQKQAQHQNLATQILRQLLLLSTTQHFANNSSYFYEREKHRT